MAKISYPKIASFKIPAAFQAYLDQNNIPIPLDDHLPPASDSPLNQPFQFANRTIGNRCCVLPLEGWDCLTDGRATAITHRRWQRFGLSGAKLIWSEAAAISPDARGNPCQLIVNQSNLDDLAGLRQTLIDSHAQQFQRTDDLFIGLQLTHAGRYCRPDGLQPKPNIAYHHPILDRQLNLKSHPPITDDQIEQIIADFITAAQLAARAGFDFIDIKTCHGYLLHEFLTAHHRPGPYGGPFENRTRFLKDIITTIQKQIPNLHIAVRLSLFDFAPFTPDQNNIAHPEFNSDCPQPFGADPTGLNIDLTESLRLLDLLDSLNVNLICATAGSPYYNPHIQRPALFPPVGEYLPPEDPLLGVARLIDATSQLKRACPHLTFIGAGYSYLQQFLPHVLTPLIRDHHADFVGLGRALLPYPNIFSDILKNQPLNKKQICRTISHCITAARNQLPAGCYPLDPFYQALPQQKKLKQIINTHKNP